MDVGTPHTTNAGTVLILMGLRGSGKSTLGRLLSEHLGTPFIDLDDRTRARLGYPTIREAWNAKGETAFRAAESDELRDILAAARCGFVLALGGGTPTAPGAEALLRSAVAGGARLFYLRCTPDVLRQRLRASGGPGNDRPSLTGRDPLDEIDDVFARRDPLYSDLATDLVEGITTAEEGVAAVLGRLGR